MIETIQFVEAVSSVLIIANIIVELARPRWFPWRRRPWYRGCICVALYAFGVADFLMGLTEVRQLVFTGLYQIIGGAIVVAGSIVYLCKEGRRLERASNWKKARQHV